MKVDGVATLFNELIKCELALFVQARKQRVAQGKHWYPSVGNRNFFDNARRFSYEFFITQFAVVCLVVFVRFALVFGVVFGLGLAGLQFLVTGFWFRAGSRFLVASGSMAAGSMASGSSLMASGSSLMATGSLAAGSSLTASSLASGSSLLAIGSLAADSWLTASSWFSTSGVLPSRGFWSCSTMTCGLMC